MKTILSIVVILFTTYAIAQSQTGVEKALLKKWNGKEIKYNPDDPDWYQIRKKKKWGLYADDQEILPKVYDSIGWFNGLNPYCIIKNKGKYAILLNPFEIPDAVDRLQFSYDVIKTIHKDGKYYTKVKHNGKWGLVDWFSGFLAISYRYNTPTEVPLMSLSPWEITLIKNARKKLQADWVILDSINGDGVYIARYKMTEKWGMFQDSNGKIRTLIPMNYDKIDFFNWNADFTAVYNNNKIGFYLSKWTFEDEAKQSVDCLYDAFHKFSFENNIYLAVQKNGKWGWVDWMTGEEKSAFQYATKEELPTPDF